MNTKEKVSPDNLTEEEITCRSTQEHEKCPCCGGDNIEYGSGDLEEEWAKEMWSCQDCNSEWAFFYRIDHMYIYEDNYNTYNKWVAENRDKQIDEILKD